MVKNILLSLEIFCIRISVQDSQGSESNSSKTDPQSIRLSKSRSGLQTMKQKEKKTGSLGQLKKLT